MKQSSFMEISPKDLTNFNRSELKVAPINFEANLEVQNFIPAQKAYLIREKLVEFFGVRINWIHDCLKKGIQLPYKIAQGAYTRKSHSLKRLCVFER